MYTRIIRPEQLEPSELDDYLEEGWYRIGQTMMTCRFLMWGHTLRSAIWTRVPLEQYRFRKSLRKLMSRVERRFQITEGPLVVDAEREALYQRYLTVASGERASTLREFLYGGSDRDLFHTRELRITEAGRLVGFSWFDLGEVSLQSLIGVYEPDHARLSLGFYTMLAELRYGIEAGLRYHYSGYVLPGELAMDYKLRVGGLEFLETRTRDWRPWEEFTRREMPTERLRSALWTARSALRRRGVPASVRGYPMFEVGADNPELEACLDQPLVVECYPRRGSNTALMVTWDLDRRRYSLLRCVRAVGRYRRADDEGGPGTVVELWVVVDRVGSCATAEAVAQKVAMLGPPSGLDSGA
jgi:arginyl-tRNA--protein-N-Asp/Glu arginylyltransferase